MSRDDNKYKTGPVGRKIEQLISIESFKDEKFGFFHELTDREKDVLRLVAQGLKTLDIAAQLGISPVTVQNHRASIRQKLSIGSESDYFRYAYAFGLVDL